MIIASSLLKLLEKTPLERISVTQIMEEAEMSTRTFYNYFSDKYDVLVYFWQESMKPYCDRALSVFLEKMVQIIEQNQNAFRNALRYGGQNNLRDEMARDIAEKWCTHISKDIYKYENADTVNFYLNQAYSGIVNILSVTLESNDYSLAFQIDMEKYIQDILFPVFHKYFHSDPLPLGEHIDFIPPSGGRQYL